MTKFWKIKNEVSSKGNELILDGVISSESWYEDEVTPKLFRDELNALNGNITVRINSPGGDVYAGVAIYNALREYDGQVTVLVDGIAASIASIIAMAGDKIVMQPGAMMMIHKASSICYGTSDDLIKAAEYLEKVEVNLVEIYVSRSGLETEKVKALLEAETWMNSEEAVEMGFADEAIPAKTTFTDTVKNIAAAMDLVRPAITQPMMSLRTKIKTQEAAEAPTEPEPLTEETLAEEEAPAEPEAPEEAPVEPEAPVAPEETNQPIKEKPMSDVDTIAKNQVIAPADQATVAPKVTNYLKTKASLEDFANVLKATAGRDGEAVKSAWKDVLVKNGLTDPDYFALPEPVITSIEDAVKASGIYSLLNHTGLDVFKVVWDDTDADIDTSRAGGHKKGDTKDEQVLDFDKRVIRAQYIYKYLVLDKETIRENRSTGALMRFVLNELPVRIIREIERAVVIGDGRDSGNKRHITSFVAIKADVVAENDFAASYTPVEGESRAESVARAMDLLLSEGEVILIAKKGFSTEARFEKNTDGDLMFPIGSSASAVLGVSRIIEPTWFTDATDTAYDAYLVVPSAYKTVGDNSIESFTNFRLDTNENEFLQEIYKGGALASLKAAVGIEAVAES